MKSILTLENLSTGYPGRPSSKVVTSQINTELYEGELVCLIGPNGAGKSTLMRTISGEQKPIAGKVYLEGVSIHHIPPKVLAQKLSLVLTDRVSAGMLSAYEVVALGRYPYTGWTGRLSQRDHHIIQEAIDRVGARDLLKRTLSELSDGERQKIMIARAFAQEPEIMILDEVTAFLDLPRRVEIMKLLRNMARESGKSILLSTHDMDLALRGADRIWLLPKGGAFQTGAPEDLVLNGAFQDAFRSEGIHFDKASGSFTIHAAYQASVNLVGVGDELIWTARALDRNGIQIDEHSEVIITIQESDENLSWQLKTKLTEKKFNSIYSLLHELQQSM